MNRWTIFTTLAIFVASSAQAATLEVPQNGGNASGIGYFSGWKCPPNNNISIVVDGGTPIPVPSGVRRGDTSSACGNDGLNGYIGQINFNLLGPGSHTAVARQNGVPFAQSTFTVTTFGQNFLTGAAGTYVLQNFPQAGQTATIQWAQGAQNFIIVDRSGGGGQQCPANGPITNLRLDCSGFNYFYEKGLSTAGLNTDGSVVRVCVTDAITQDLFCAGGPAQSTTTFNLIEAAFGGGPIFSLGAGSSGNITGAGQTLNFTVIIESVSPFVGYSYFATQPATSVAGENATGVAASNVRRLADALNGGAGGIEPRTGQSSIERAEALRALAGNARP